MISDDSRQPRRKSLPHEAPRWIDPARETYFITVNSAARGVNVLCHEGVARLVFDSIDHRHRSRVWYCHLCLLMPDHLHALISFIDRQKPLQQTVSDWKRWLSVKGKLKWQSDFFDHRIRSAHEEVSKVKYILQNPVRQSLVERAEDWPFIWRPKEEAG